MKFKIFIVGILAILSINIYSQELKKDETVENYRKNISALNLINGLYLTDSQIKSYLGVLHDLANFRKEYQLKLDSYNNELVKQFGQLCSEVSEGKGIKRETEKSANDIHRLEKELKESYSEQLCLLENKLIPILTENQICIIDEFKPCLIPPKNLKDPARVGQAKGDASGTVIHLERLRKVPDKRYEDAKRKFIDMYIDKYEEKINVLNPDEKEKEIKRVIELLDYSKILSEIDFELKKENIAKDLLLDKVLKYPKRKNQMGKIGRFLLDTDLIPVLEKRLMAAK